MGFNSDLPDRAIKVWPVIVDVETLRKTKKRRQVEIVSILALMVGTLLLYCCCQE